MIEWKPYPGMQTRFLQSTAFETLAGGARGPGKTDVGVVNGLKPKYLEEPRARGLVIRKNSDDLADWLDRARYWYARYGGVVTGKPGIIKFPSGYKIRTGHLKDESAYTKYQGQEYQWILIEELTQIGREVDYLKLIASCRSSIPGLDPRVYATTNPGGVGHGWVKKRFVDPSPPNTMFTGSDTGRTRVFLPGTVDQNPALAENDPDYVKFLDGLKDTDVELWKAWRLGSWDVFAGQFFKEFRRDRHIIHSFTPKKELNIVSGLDWGRTDAFCFYPSIVTTVKYTGRDKTNPEDTQERDYTFHRVFTFNEVWGHDKGPREWGEEITRKISLDKVLWISSDNMIFNLQNDNSASIADQFYDFDERFRGRLRAASKHREARWETMHKWLSIAPDGFPYWLITDNCVNLIRTIPEAIHDETHVEDIDQAGEDDPLDATGYMLQDIKFIDAKLGGVSPKYKPQHLNKPMPIDNPIPLDAWGET